MANSISGKILEITPIIYVTLRDGTQAPKQQLIIDAAVINPSTGVRGYENPLAFDLFGEGRVAMASLLAPGQEVNVSYNLRGRRFTGKDGITRYYVDLDAFSIVVQGADVVQQQVPTVQQPQPMQHTAPSPQPYSPAYNGGAYNGQQATTQQWHAPAQQQYAQPSQQGSDLPF